MMQFCDRLSQLSTGQGQWWRHLCVPPSGKPIGVADYQLVVPQEELKKVVAEEVAAFGKAFPLYAESEESSE